MKTHELKSWPEQYAATAQGYKTHEWRRDDRGYEVGDRLALLEWNPRTEKYTGRVQYRMVSWITRGAALDIPEGWCIMSIVTPDIWAITRPYPGM